MPRAMPRHAMPCWCRTRELWCRSLVVSGRAEDSPYRVVPWPVVPCLCRAIACHAVVVPCLCAAVSCHAFVVPYFCRAVQCNVSS